MNSGAKWLIPVLLGLQAAFVGSTFETWYGCLPLFGVFASVALLHRRWGFRETDRPRFSRSIRWIGNSALYLLTTLLIGAWRFGDYAGETINPMAFVFDALAHTALVASFLLWAFHPRAGHPAMLALGLSVVLLCVAAGGASQSMASQIAVALVTSIGFVFSSNLILGHRARQAYVQVGGAAGSVVSPNAGFSDSGRLGMLFSLLVLSAILMTTSAIARVTDYMLPNVKTMVHNQLTNSFEAMEDQSAIGNSRYVRGSRLGSIRRHMLGDPASIALRAYSIAVPGYLRGTVFDAYSNGRWSVLSNERLPIHSESTAIQPRQLMSSGQGLTRLQGSASRSLRRFFLHRPDDQRIEPIEIHNEPLKGHVVFTPLATRWLEANASTISISHHEIVQAGVDVTNPYVCGVAKSPSPETLQPQRRRLLINVPLKIRAAIRQFAQSICDSQPTAPAKAKAIEQYFQENFAYSLATDPPRARLDPIVQFLTTKHAAHCEYFATATVLLLRSSGVPARYVTGYVTMEQNDEEPFWIARNRDAHAWAEAYDDLTGNWFPVEPTPGRSYESMWLTNTAAGSADGVNSTLASDGDSEDSLWSYLWGWITSTRATDPLFVIFRFGTVPLFCIVVFLLWKSFQGGQLTAADPEDVKSRKMLQRIDRKLKKLSLVREPHETLHQFAARIENSVDCALVDPTRHGEFLAQAASWYRQYATARYRGQSPIPFGQATAA